MQAEILLATLADEDALLALMREFYAIEHLTYDEPVARKALRQIVTDDRFGRVYLIRGDGALAGYLVLTFGFSLEFHGRDAFVDEFYVRERWRGQGLGRAALAYVEEVCRGYEIEALHLEVDHVNQRARKLYEQSGYADHQRHLMTKWLR